MSHNGGKHNGQSAQVLHQFLSGAGSVYAPTRLLWYINNADMNSTADQAFTKYGTFSSYVLIQAKSQWVSGANPVNTAAGGVYSATAKGGSVIIAASQAYSNNSGTGTGTGLTLAPAGHGARSDAALYLSLTTGQGAASISNMYLYGIPLS